MSKVRVLVGTRKGAFILTSDGKREKWDVSGPHFAGWEIYHLKGSPVGSESALRVAIERLVWANHPAFRRRRKNLASTGNAGGEPAAPGQPKARAINSSTMRPPSRSPRISGTTARSIPGNLSGSGIWSRLSPIPTRFTPAWKTLRFSARPTAGRTGRNSPDCAATAPAPNGSPARAACACTRSFWIPAIRSESISRSPPQAPSEPTTAARAGSRSTADCARNIFRTRMRRWATAFTTSP